jgi:hypothetical protein
MVVCGSRVLHEPGIARDWRILGVTESGASGERCCKH